MVGKVGSGKSSLLSAITAEMEKLRGMVSLQYPLLGQSIEILFECNYMKGVCLINRFMWKI